MKSKMIPFLLLLINSIFAGLLTIATIYVFDGEISKGLGLFALIALAPTSVIILWILDRKE